MAERTDSRFASHNVLDHIMGTEEAAGLWGISQDHVKRLCREGVVKARLIGKSWIIDKNQPNPSQPDHPKNWRNRTVNQSTKEA